MPERETDGGSLTPRSREAQFPAFECRRRCSLTVEFGGRLADSVRAWRRPLQGRARIHGRMVPARSQSLVEIPQSPTGTTGIAVGRCCLATVRTSPNVDVQAERNAENDRRRRIIRRAINHRRSVSTAPAATAVSSAAAMITATTAMPATAPAISCDGRARNRRDGKCRGEKNPRCECRRPSACQFGINPGHHNLPSSAQRQSRAVRSSLRLSHGPRRSDGRTETLCRRSSSAHRASPSTAP
jgi:hypothetical protein